MCVFLCFVQPLMAAAARGHRAVVRLLLEAGADATRQHTLDHKTAATMAGEMGHSGIATDIVRFTNVRARLLFTAPVRCCPHIALLLRLCVRRRKR